MDHTCEPTEIADGTLICKHCSVKMVACAPVAVDDEPKEVEFVGVKAGKIKIVKKTPKKRGKK